MKEWGSSSEMWENFLEKLLLKLRLREGKILVANVVEKCIPDRMSGLIEM